MSVTSGWGRLTWDQSQWGGSTILNTGWGAQSWDSEGDWGELSNQTITLDGQSSTTSVNAEGTLSFNETGWGRITWNTADWGEGRDELVTPTGVQADTTLGTVTHGIGVPLEMIPNPPTGTQLLKIMRGQVGEITIGIGQVLDGQQSEFATPTLSYSGTLVGWGRKGWNVEPYGDSVNKVLNVVGVDATASVGSILPADAVGLSGLQASTSLGDESLQIDSTPPISGQEATASPGILGLLFGPAGAVSGVSASFNVGTLGLEFGPADITGVSSTASVGEIEITSVELVNLTGISSSTSIGAIVPAIGIPLTGIASTTGIGSITPNDVMGLTGLQATFVDPSIGIQAYKNVDTGSNDSFSNIDSGSNSSYSDASTGSNDTYSNVATGSNTSYSDAA